MQRQWPRISLDLAHVPERCALVLTTIKFAAEACPSAAAHNDEARRKNPRAAPVKINRKTALIRVAAIMKMTLTQPTTTGKKPVIIPQ